MISPWLKVATTCEVAKLRRALSSLSQGLFLGNLNGGTASVSWCTTDVVQSRAEAVTTVFGNLLVAIAASL